MRVTKFTSLTPWLLLPGAIKLVYEMGWMLAYEGRGLMHPDVLIYLTVGRGMLNGLQPYTDLFESKPPGMFLLAALSLLTTNGTLLMRVVQDASLVGLPALTGWTGWKLTRQRAPTALCVVVGSLFSLWAQRTAGALQTETFAVLPAALYVYTLFRGGLCLRTLAVLMCLLMKEPFLVGIAVAAVLHAGRPRELRETLLLPVLLAGAAFLLLLLLLGVARPYLFTYLPGMLGHRIQAGAVEPLYLRALWVQRLFSSLTTFSSIRLLGWAAALLWVSALWRGAGRRAAVLFGVGLAGGCLLLGQYFVLAGLLYQTSRLGMSAWQTLLAPGFWPISLAYTLATGAEGVVLLLLWRGNRPAFWRLCLGLAILPVVNVLIGIADYGTRYMLFLLPVLLSLFFTFLRDRVKLLPLAIAVAACMALMYRHVRGDDPVATSYLRRALVVSPVVDRIMDACGYDRFAFDGVTRIPGFTRHSPIGPVFQPALHTYLGVDHPLFRETYRNLRAARFMVREVTDEDSHIPGEITEKFVEDAPPCARGMSASGYVFLYRAP